MWGGGGGRVGGRLRIEVCLCAGIRIKRCVCVWAGIRDSGVCVCVGGRLKIKRVCVWGG